MIIEKYILTPMLYYRIIVSQLLTFMYSLDFVLLYGKEFI